MDRALRELRDKLLVRVVGWTKDTGERGIPGAIFGLADGQPDAPRPPRLDRAAYQREWSQANPDKVRAYKHDFYARHRDELVQGYRERRAERRLAHDRFGLWSQLGGRTR